MTVKIVIAWDARNNNIISKTLLKLSTMFILLMPQQIGLSIDIFQYKRHKVSINFYG